MKKVRVDASRVYDVIIENGILDRAGELSCEIINPCRAVILTDDTVGALYADRLSASLKGSGYSVLVYTVLHGESSKSAESYIKFLGFLAENRITRSDCLFALGGGVIGDLCGFCAATYLRGIRFVQIPTTLLAMVDSSVGGKTAINLPEGKNLVGAFYQPSVVLCDPDVLSTLPPEIYADGCAEAIKYGIINDRPLFEMLKIGAPISDVIECCVRDKRDIVNMDERDTSVRQLLNLGHTAAHSIEILSNFTVSHGSAVAIGTYLISRASYTMGLCPESDLEEIRNILTQYSLPIECPYSAEALADVALGDKKRQGSKITLVIPYGIGDSRLVEVDVSSLAEIFAKGI